MTRHILLIGKEHNERSDFAVALKQAGFKTIEVDDGQGACELISSTGTEKESPDLIIADENQSRASCISLLYGLKKNGLSAPVLVISAHIDKTTITALLGCGCAELLVRPFWPSELVKRVESILHKELIYGGTRHV